MGLDSDHIPPNVQSKIEDAIYSIPVLTNSMIILSAEGTVVDAENESRLPLTWCKMKGRKVCGPEGF